MKHPYATNLHERHGLLLLFVAAVSLGLAIATGALIGKLGIAPPAWFDVPSTAAFYGMLYSFLKFRAWRWQWLRKAGILKTPILEGNWDGYVITSFDEHSGRHNVAVAIHQNWTELLVVLKSEHSKSLSQIASLIVGDETILAYEYCNEPRVGAATTMHAHRGMARLVLNNDENELNGEYYSGRDRQNCGKLCLRKVST